MRCKDFVTALVGLLAPMLVNSTLLRDTEGGSTRALELQMTDSELLRAGLYTQHPFSRMSNVASCYDFNTHNGTHKAQCQATL